MDEPGQESRYKLTFDVEVNNAPSAEETCLAAVPRHHRYIIVSRKLAMKPHGFFLLLGEHRSDDAHPGSTSASCRSTTTNYQIHFLSFQVDLVLSSSINQATSPWMSHVLIPFALDLFLGSKTARAMESTIPGGQAAQRCEGQARDIGHRCGTPVNGITARSVAFCWSSRLFLGILGRAMQYNSCLNTIYINCD